MMKMKTLLLIIFAIVLGYVSFSVAGRSHAVRVEKQHQEYGECVRMINTPAHYEATELPTPWQLEWCIKMVYGLDVHNEKTKN